MENQREENRLQSDGTQATVLDHSSSETDAMRFELRLNPSNPTNSQSTVV